MMQLQPLRHNNWKVISHPQLQFKLIENVRVVSAIQATRSAFIKLFLRLCRGSCRRGRGRNHLVHAIDPDRILITVRVRSTVALISIRSIAPEASTILERKNFGAVPTGDRTALKHRARNITTGRAALHAVCATARQGTALCIFPTSTIDNIGWQMTGKG
jgi:hypothetical protein